MNWGEMVVQLADEVISRPSIFTVACGEIETFDEMAMEICPVLLDQRVMAKDLDNSVIMGNGEEKDFLMQLIYSRCGSRFPAGLLSLLVELKNRINYRSSTSSIPAIGFIESVGAAFRLASEKWEKQVSGKPRRCIGCIMATVKLVDLRFSECRWEETHCKIWTWYGTRKRDDVIPGYFNRLF